jgi:hypothetical protein
VLSLSIFPHIYATTVPTPAFTLQERGNIKKGAACYDDAQDCHRSFKDPTGTPKKWIMGLK